MTSHERLEYTVLEVCEQNIVEEYFVLIDTFPASFIHTKLLLQHLRVTPGLGTYSNYRVFSCIMHRANSYDYRSQHLTVHTY